MGIFNEISPNATEDYVTTVSGTLVSQMITDHSELTGLDTDDHVQYIRTDGSRGFTSTVSGVAPENDTDLITREYMLGVMDGSISPPTVSGTIVSSLVQFHYVEDSAESSTSSTSWIQKMRLTASGLPAGNYRIGWTYSWRQSKSNTDFLLQIEVDDTDQIFYYQASPYVDVLYWQPVTGFYYYDLLTSGTHTVDMDFMSSTAAATSYIKECKIEFWRIT